MAKSDAAAGDPSVVLLGASEARIRVLELVIAHGEVTAAELMDALDLTRNGVGHHLAALTESGFLIERRATHPRGRGGIIYWRADRDQIHQAMWSLSGRVLGYSAT